MTFGRLLAASLLAASMASARTLYVGSFQGLITAYSFDESNAPLKQIFQTTESSPSSTWQTIFGNYLFSVSETSAKTEGVITAYKIESDKKLTKKGSARSLFGPVSIAVANDGKLLVSASYGGGGVDSFLSDGQGSLTHLQRFSYKLPKPGPVPDRQSESHPHQAIIDPTGKYAVVPDLGADLLRVYSVDEKGISELFQSFTSTPGGFGPRHAVFFPPGNEKATHLFVVGELANEIITYKVTYGDKHIGLLNIDIVSTFGSGRVPTYPSPTAGEIALSPDGKYLYVSNRNDKTQADKSQDSIAAFSVSPDAKLTFLRMSASGGVSPRHFSITTDGNWVAIANGENGNFGIFRRYNENGTISSLPIISTAAPGPACVTWYD